ncbi:coiled-coil domain-containing protein 178-like isoform X2 [Rhineura floridana]|nr:coiled-coil domain-containing protein 178-like isoform X2 [Rhineura floridana]
MPWDSDIKNVEETKDIWLSLSSELKAEQSLYWEGIQPLKQKTTVVLAEVTELVTRLENERKRAEEALEIEKCRRKKLYVTADGLSLWRLEQLPIAVQKEWEKCSRDITELQWHFEEKNQQLQDAVNQLTQINVANAKVLEHIGYMKKYSPLLGEKLSYEDNAMEEAQKIYMQTKCIYDTVHQKLVKVKIVHQEIIEECEKERISMAQQIQAAELQLIYLMNQLKEAEMLYDDFSNKIKAKKEAIIQCKNRLEELIKQEANTKADLMSWHDNVRRLNLKVAAQENENKDLLNEYFEEMKVMETSKSTQDSDLENLKERLLTLLEEIAKTQNENKRLYDENGGFVQKFRESARRRVGYQSEIQVLQKNIRRLEEHLKKANKELYSAELAYDEAKTKLEELEQNIAKEKMRFKNLEDNVKKQIRDEISAWKLTQKRVRALQADLDKRGKEYAKLEEKIQKKLAELEQHVADQAALLEKNKEIQKSYAEQITHLNKQIQELDEREAKRKKVLDEQKKGLQSLLTDAKRKCLDISSQLDKVNANIAKFQDQIAKLSELSKGKQKQLDNTEKILAELREKNSRIKAKEQNAQTLVDFLHDRLDYIEKKIKTDSRVFEELLWNRQKALRTQKVCVV